MARVLLLPQSACVPLSPPLARPVAFGDPVGPTHAVSEIVDRAQKEDKLENGCAKLKDIWAKVEFEFHPVKNMDGVSTIKMKDDDFEVLEDNQVLVQGMMANRYMATFQDDITGWNKKLGAVYDVVSIMNEIQRTWSYLESLFLHSDEVKKELPEASERFRGVDRDIKGHLATFAQKKNVVACCHVDGLLKNLEKLQGELEICEKALSDYMESKRRAFPRFYFVSTSDLLDILSNGNDPTKVCSWACRFALYFLTDIALFPRFSPSPGDEAHVQVLPGHREAAIGQRDPEPRSPSQGHGHGVVRRH